MSVESTSPAGVLAGPPGMRDAKSVGSVQWVFLVRDASQVLRGHGGCPMLLGQVWRRQQALCTSRIL